MKIALTRATGLLGPYVLRKLDKTLGAKTTVWGIDSAPKFDNRAQWKYADFSTTFDCASIVQDCDVIVHLAAELRDSARMNAVNVDATADLFAHAERSRTKLFIYTSSVGVYGAPRSRFITEDSPLIDKNPFSHQNSLSVYA